MKDDYGISDNESDDESFDDDYDDEVTGDGREPAFTYLSDAEEEDDDEDELFCVACMKRFKTSMA